MGVHGSMRMRVRVHIVATCPPTCSEGSCVAKEPSACGGGSSGRKGLMQSRGSQAYSASSSSSSSAPGVCVGGGRGASISTWGVVGTSLPHPHQLSCYLATLASSAHPSLTTKAHTLCLLAVPRLLSLRGTPPAPCCPIPATTSPTCSPYLRPRPST